MDAARPTMSEKMSMSEDVKIELPPSDGFSPHFGRYWGEQAMAAALDSRDEHWSRVLSMQATQAGLRIRELEEQRDKLQAFKSFVHRRLDTAKVPTHPDGKHSKEGCRIGDRLDLVIEARDEAERKLREAGERIAELEERLMVLLVVQLKRFQEPESNA